ncbi:MAG TPA: homoserine kinase [Actinomycetes bacterium]|nr:homoserine kinase [Actinomycetes bacterium]
MTGPAEVTVAVPATSANLGPGYDALGLALELRDEVRVRAAAADQPAVTVEVVGEGAATLPRDASHLVVRAVLAAFADLAVPAPPLVLHCTNRIPHGRGLGSSAAAVVAGVLAARALAGAVDDDGRTAALAVSTALEGHPDNAAAALLGGLTIAWDDGPGPRAVRVDPSPRLRATLLVPDVELATTTARGLLPATVPHADAAHAAGRSALLVEALTRRPDLLLPATEDRLHQAQRAPAMPATADLVARLRADGLAAVVSGAGPSVLVLSDADADADTDADVDVERRLRGSLAGWRVLPLAVARGGATLG